jgi:hypothetical protein
MWGQPPWAVRPDEARRPTTASQGLDLADEGCHPTTPRLMDQLKLITTHFVAPASGRLSRGRPARGADETAALPRNAY